MSTVWMVLSMENVREIASQSGHIAINSILSRCIPKDQHQIRQLGCSIAYPTTDRSAIEPMDTSHNAEGMAVRLGVHGMP